MLNPITASSMQRSTTMTGSQLHRNYSEDITPVQGVHRGHHAAVGAVLHVQHLQLYAHEEDQRLHGIPAQQQFWAQLKVLPRAEHQRLADKV